MIRAVAFCPHPPVLVPVLAGSARAEVTDLTAAAMAAVSDSLLACTPDRDSTGAEQQARLLVVADAPGHRPGPLGRPGSMREFGGNHEDPDATPLPFAVAAWLLSKVTVPRADGGPDPDGWIGARAIDAADLTSEFAAVEGPTVLWVMGDGTARRGQKAPGHYDPRAEGFDRAVQAALMTGDAGALADLDALTGEQLWAGGTRSWRAVGALLAGCRWDAELRYADDPFGVMYFVASWRRAGPSSASEPGAAELGSADPGSGELG